MEARHCARDAQHKDMAAARPATHEPGMQESDLLEQLPAGVGQQGSGSDHIMLVSLGSFCGIKLSFKHMGRGAETLPFDWMRTRHAGLMHFLEHDFEGFFDFTVKKPVPNCNMTVYQSRFHSFWHDDPTDPGMIERYTRRIDRFNRIDASAQPVLFVRCVPTTDELADVPELLAVLRQRHGKYACLLCIIDLQMTTKGAAIVEGIDNLLVYYLSGDNHVSEDGVTPAPPYSKPVQCALDWIIGKPIQAMQFTNMENIAACADETHWHLSAVGGINAFETSEDLDEARALRELPGGRVPAPLPDLLADDLERRECAVAVQADDDIVVVSLGCSSLTKWSLQEMGRGSKALPFDWLHVTLEGILHFLNLGFSAPIRPGLGAGGQRPLEGEGFFDFHTRRRVPGTRLTMCRSDVHSFWHDDISDPEVRSKYSRQFDRFLALGEEGKALLFVRAVATTAELLRADELLGALTRRFGARAALLLIVDFQVSACGARIVQGHEKMLVYFLEGGARVDDAPYRKPVESALDWLRGKSLEASSAQDLQTLHRLADATSWGLVGPGGHFAAFESLSAIAVSAPNAYHSGADVDAVGDDANSHVETEAWSARRIQWLRNLQKQQLLRMKRLAVGSP